MILTRIKLRHFRSYEELDLDFGPGLTLIVGDNAAGKTNLAEAIQFLSLARSFRTNEEENLIQDGAEMATIEATVREGAMNRTLRIEVSRKGKRVFLNGKPIQRLSELSRLVNVIVFSPADVSLFMGSPGERRNFLDVSLSKQSLDYFRLIGSHTRILKERNALLKGANPDLGLLDVLDHQLAELSEPIVGYRSLYLAQLSAALPSLLGRLRGDDASAALVYRPFLKQGEGFVERAYQAYRASRENDLFRKSTGIGIQREDFSLRLKGKDVAEFGSQGENRMAVLALKLCPYFLVEDEEKKPICVLDDVTSELDAEHNARLFEILKEFSQAFVTTTQYSIEGASYVDVAANKATRRNQ
jgi:DNA replication and repair protein RecF